MSTRKAWLSGAGGFAGHHVLEQILLTTDWDVVVTDSFRHKGVTDRIRQVLDGHDDWRKRLTVITHDLAAPFSASLARFTYGQPDFMIAMAADSNVDRSIADPVPLVKNNTDVMLNTLELARLLQPGKVIVVSTDEVYGPARRGEPGFREWAPAVPSSPYAASKAAAEAIAVAYWRTYGVPLIIINSVNLFGERQDPAKYVPKVIRCVLTGETVTVHGREDDIGTRHYLHARNLASALVFLLGNRRTAPAFPAYATVPGGWQVTAGRPDRYNVASADPVSNLELAQMIAALAGKELRYELQDSGAARPGHDPHYGLNPGRLRRCGWNPPVPLEAGLKTTVEWFLAHPEWLGL